MAKPVVDLSAQYKPHSRQILAHTAKERFILYGGAFGGGKTIWLANEVKQLCLETPGNIGYICRHELPAFRRSVLIELEKYLTPEIIEQHHQTENYFRFKNESLLFYGGLGDDRAGLQRLTSMTLGFFAIDQCEETTEMHFNMLAARLRLIKTDIHYKGLLTCNPSPGWVKQKFIEQKMPDHVFIQSLPKDNPYLPKDYESGLRAIYPPEWIKSMLEGDWTALEGGYFVFSDAEIGRAIDREVNQEGEIYMGVDLAWGGADENVAIIRRGDKVLSMERWIYKKEESAESINKITQLISQWNVPHRNVIIDAVSGGALVYSGLKKLGYNVTDFSAGEKADDDVHYVNRRAEMYYQLQKKFHEGTISIPDDRDLKAQLASIRYEPPAGEKRIQLVSKEKMRKEGQKSPDRSDALAMAFYQKRLFNPNIRFI